MSRPASRKPSGFMRELQAAVLRSGRWQKWLLPQEIGLSFDPCLLNAGNGLSSPGRVMYGPNRLSWQRVGDYMRTWVRLFGILTATS